MAFHAIESAHRARRYERAGLWVVIGTALLIVLVVIVGVALDRQSSIRDAGDRQECLARAVAVYAEASGNAFADGAPPAAIRQAARVLHGDIERCG